MSQLAASYSERSLLTSRLAVTGVFFVAGAVLANWVSRVPQVRDNIGLSEATLGLALLAISIGVIGGVVLTGGLIARFGSRRVTLTAGIVMSFALIPVGLANSFWALVAGLTLVGAALSTTDVAMNAQGVEVERRWKRPIIGSFHAAYSVGGFAGALMGALLVRLSFTVLEHFVLAAVLMALLVWLCGRGLVTIANEQEAERASGGAIRLPGRALWPLGLVVFSAGLGEGAMADWSAIYLRDIVQTSEAAAAFGFAAFSLLMTLGRVVGDWLARRFTKTRLVRGGGLLAAAGLLLAIVVPQPLTALLGFALVGAGLASAVPLAFSAAGNLPDVPSGTGIAGVATVGYLAFLVGPVVIGFVAEATTLPLALLLVMLVMASLFFSGQALDASKRG